MSKRTYSEYGSSSATGKEGTAKMKRFEGKIAVITGGINRWVAHRRLCSPIVTMPGLGRSAGWISDPVFTTGVCCGTLYELPRSVGSLREGTLLWAGSNTADKHMAIRVYRRDDEGRSWSFLGEVQNPRPGQI